MSVATSTAIGIAGAIGAAGAIGSSVIGSHAASSAANTQAQAADQAAQLNYQAEQNALDFQKQVYADQQKNIAPWLTTGGSALGSLSNLMGISPGSPFNPLQASGAPETVVQLPSGSTSNPATAAPLQFDAGEPAARGPKLLTNNAQLRGGPTMMLDAMPMSNLAGGGGNPFLNGDTITNSRLPSTGGVPPIGSGGPPSNLPVSTLPIPPALGSNTNFAPPSPSTSQPGSSPDAPATGPGSAGFGSLLQGFDQPFVAPTGITEQNDPGFQARLSLGQQALENSAAARGGLLSGGTAKAMDQYAQDYASNEYNNVYNRALTEYQQQYNIFQQNQANQFNRLAALSGVGQTAAGQLNSAGTSAAGNIGNTLLGSASQIGQDLNNAGAARASGFVGGANAISGGLSSLGSLGSNLALLSLLSGGGGSSNAAALAQQNMGF